MSRERLLADAIAYTSTHGLADLSLRDLADNIGTSHRMLLYHFGSRAGLVTAIVEQIEADQRAFLRTLEGSPTEVMRSMWFDLIRSGRAGPERLFFELYGMALQDRPGTEGFLPGAVEQWLQATGPEDRVKARLALAVIRGLLLDLLATDDLAGTTAALEVFLASMNQSPIS